MNVAVDLLLLFVCHRYDSFRKIAAIAAAATAVVATAAVVAVAVAAVEDAVAEEDAVAAVEAAEAAAVLAVLDEWLHTSDRRTGKSHHSTYKHSDNQP